MTTIKRLLRRLDGYTLEAFNAPRLMTGPTAELAVTPPAEGIRRCSAPLCLS